MKIPDPVTCKLCGKTYGYSKITSHIKKAHNMSSKEYYDKYLKKEDEGYCLTCGKPVKFINIIQGYTTRFCSVHCEMVNPKVKAKYAENYQKKYGVDHIWASEYGRNKIKQTMIKKFGVENCLQSEIIKQKVKETNLERYGVPCNLNFPEVIAKANSPEALDKKCHSRRGKKGISKIEKYMIEQLTSKGLVENKDFYFQYRSNKYPFACDFYLIKSNTYIEINGYWMHGFHPFNELDEQDIKKLNRWKEKSAHSDAYKHAIYIWTESDVLKRETAIQNNLKFIELYDYKDIDNFILTL